MSVKQTTRDHSNGSGRALEKKIPNSSVRGRRRDLKMASPSLRPTLDDEKKSWSLGSSETTSVIRVVSEQRRNEAGQGFRAGTSVN